MHRLAVGHAIARSRTHCSRDATVTFCHSKTANLPAIVKQADILVAAMGKANFVRGDWLKPGVVILDVGEPVFA